MGMADRRCLPTDLLDLHETWFGESCADLQMIDQFHLDLQDFYSRYHSHVVNVSMSGELMEMIKDQDLLRFDYRMLRFD